MPGSTWIDQGPQGSFMHFNKYGMYYQIPNAGSWTPIDTGIANEVRHGILASWNTHGLTPGSYYVRLLSFNDLGDSIEAIRQVTLLPTILGVNAMNQTKFISVYPNPTSGSIQVNFELVKEATISLELSDLSGKILKKTEEIYLSSGNQSIVMDTQGLVSGMYFY
ncbi:MAG: T9SS type A sorting domain-containing protein [Bacteroidetes bacterium]|nr:T9SS type A sorting domain-containing protein [Bacteroidota bacterium]